MTAAFGNSYAYDSVGNMTSRTIGGTTYTLTYDAENRMTGVSGGSISATFVYDAGGNRVKGTVNGTTTVYIAGVYEYQGGATTKYYEGATGIIALRRTGYGSNNGVKYVLGDHLGSTSVLVNQNGTLNASNYYYPYGGNRGGTQSSLTTKRFTGQYHEAGLPGGEGLYYYNARWLDAQLGRFAQADTIVPNPAASQSLNRYSYVVGNPLRIVDPSGHRPIEDAGYVYLPPETGNGGGGGGGGFGGGGGAVGGGSGGFEGHDSRDLTQWIVGEMNYLASLPEGKVLWLLQLSFSPAREAYAWYMFNEMVKNGAPLDVKDQILLQLGRSIRLSDRWFEWSTSGNILFGFYGTAWGFSSYELYAGAGAAQVMDWRNPDPGENPKLGPPLPPFYFDTADDHYAIEFGISLYHQGYGPDGQLTVDKFRSLLADYAHLGDMALKSAPLRPDPQLSAWPYSAGYFNNSVDPPEPAWMFPSF